MNDNSHHLLYGLDVVIVKDDQNQENINKFLIIIVTFDGMDLKRLIGLGLYV